MRFPTGYVGTRARGWSFGLHSSFRSGCFHDAFHTQIVSFVFPVTWLFVYLCGVFVYVRVCVRLFVGVVVWLLVCVYPFARPDHLPPTW